MYDTSGNDFCEVRLCDLCTLAFYNQPPVLFRFCIEMEVIFQTKHLFKRKEEKAILLKTQHSLKDVMQGTKSAKDCKSSFRIL